MKSSKELYNKYFKEYVLDDNKLQKLHQVLLSMLDDFDHVCRKHNIKYMLAGGSLLGAIRHKGFIPWDDDIDIMLTRDNYNKFSSCFFEELADRYILSEPLDKNYYLKAPKMYIKDSRYSEIATAGIPEYHMIFLDIFIIEYIPESSLVRKIKGMVYDFSYKASSLCIDYQYPSKPIMEKARVIDEVKTYYKVRRSLGFIFSYIGGIRFYLYIADYIAKSTKTSKLLGVPAGTSYNREVFNADLFENIIDMEFEGRFFPIPEQYDCFLKNLYGKDYMQIPDVDKRQLHLAVEIEFPHAFL